LKFAWFIEAACGRNHPEHARTVLKGQIGIAQRGMIGNIEALGAELYSCMIVKDWEVLKQRKETRQYFEASRRTGVA
jgi:hypothetical protein